MAKTMMDLDDDLLAEATIALGTATKRDTVTEALRQVVEQSRQRRQRALVDLQQVADEGGFRFHTLTESDR